MAFSVKLLGMQQVGTLQRLECLQKLQTSSQSTITVTANLCHLMSVLHIQDIVVSQCYYGILNTSDHRYYVGTKVLSEIATILRYVKSIDLLFHNKLLTSSYCGYSSASSVVPNVMGELASYLLTSADRQAGTFCGKYLNWPLRRGMQLPGAFSVVICTTTRHLFRLTKVLHKTTNYEQSPAQTQSPIDTFVSKCVT